MQTNLEIERKFLVDPTMPFPINRWSGLFHIASHIIDQKHIKQTYLLPNKQNDIARVRKEIDALTGVVKYIFNSKQPINSGISEEMEYELTKEEYKLYLCMKNRHKIPIIKSRISFDYNNLIFELDYFHQLGTLPKEISTYGINKFMILEVELNNINQKFDIPPFISVLKEVTQDEQYRNVNLAQK